MSSSQTRIKQSLIKKRGGPKHELRHIKVEDSHNGTDKRSGEPAICNARTEDVAGGSGDSGIGCGVLCV